MNCQRIVQQELRLPSPWATLHRDRTDPSVQTTRVHREVATPEHLALGRTRALAAMHTILALPGTTYLFNGQELGLEEVIDLDDSQRQDPHFHRTRGEHLGRDGCRVPMPWSRTGVSLGFGPPNGSPSWLSQPASWAELSVEAQVSNSSSSLARVRRAIAVRRAQQALLRGAMEWDGERCKGGVMVFRRVLTGHPTVTCIANMGDEATPAPADDVLCASGELVDGAVPPNTTAWFATRD